ncbi:DNA mismatch repair protein MSH4 [Cryptococcus gattii E566]|uniref:DNA mismatch repair protein MSH4 n=1 Tax=Cryptococcus gattii EJB2 TaxID=1296103 RepID=A0ABR5BZ42_9TREE|nr:DNA mismatch repair protein MSH4 [Cryptococcus gattii EJB2]KIY33943.1 DNA mismatch repair protein MSH4 [Cryptococcus gattii E566]KJD99664.1 DNA mismatch repair protein MSH4 [Cryptococcus gattii NT-10]
MPFPGQQRTAAPEKFKTVSPTASTRRRSGAGSAKFHSTTRPSTRASTRIGDVPSHVVALLQGKGRGIEIGIAAICLLTGQTVITQVADNASFDKTVQHLYSHLPNTIIVPDTMLQSGPAEVRHGNQRDMNVKEHLMNRLEDEYEIECIGVDRSHWNRETGRDFVEDLAVDDERKASTLMAIENKFYALCALSALFKYLQTWRNIEFPERSLRMKYMVAEGIMFIDIQTAKNLELVRNNLTNKATHTLYSVLNHCHTPMGMRLLRTCILQPSNVLTIIEGRLDAVQELVTAQEKLTALRSKLSTVSKLDLESIVAQASRISLLLDLMDYLQSIKSINIELAGERCKLLDMITRCLSDKQLDNVFCIVSNCLSRDATSLRKNRKHQNARIARLFAVKAGFAPLLDVARQSYQENLQDIYDLESEVNRKYGLNCQIENVGGTFQFSIPSGQPEGLLPSEFIGIEKAKNKIRFSSQELLKRCAKLSQSHQEVLLISGKTINDLIAQVKHDLGGLYHCAEAIATLDMIASFAFSALNSNYIRPDFKETLAIHGGRHPILDKLLGAGDCIPNNIYAARGPATFQIIQGPNMSGKSTYLKQIGLLTVQAMIGCFVPAEYACFILHDCLLSRLSNDNSMEKCLSTFASEMAASAMVLGLASHRSLVLIDELGRGTSSLEGIGLSHAIAESLITRQQSIVFFTTHFQDLGVILGNLPGVVKLHLKVQCNTKALSSTEFSTSFAYKVAEGAAPMEHYGLEIAKLASLPSTVLQRASEVAAQLSELEEQGRQSNLGNTSMRRRKILWELRAKLKQVQSSSRLDNDTLGEFLQNLQAQCYLTLRQSLEMAHTAISSSETG